MSTKLERKSIELALVPVVLIAAWFIEGWLL